MDQVELQRDRGETREREFKKTGERDGEIRVRRTEKERERKGGREGGDLKYERERHTERKKEGGRDVGLNSNKPVRKWTRDLCIYL